MSLCLSLSLSSVRLPHAIVKRWYTKITAVVAAQTRGIISRTVCLGLVLVLIPVLVLVLVLIMLLDCFGLDRFISFVFLRIQHTSATVVPSFRHIPAVRIAVMLQDARHEKQPRTFHLFQLKWIPCHGDDGQRRQQ